MAINDFNDGYTLRQIRVDHLNKVIQQSNANLAKVTGLQDIVYRSFVRASVDGTTNTIIFVKHDGTPAQTLDLTPMFDNYQHGIDIGKEGSTPYRQQHSMVFSGAVDVGVSGADVKVTIPGITGHVGGSERLVKKIALSGDIGSSTLATDGTMTINLGGGGGGSGTISGQIDGGGPIAIDTINIAGYKGGSVITGKTLNVDLPIPEALGGRVTVTDAYTNLKTLTLEGNRGASSISTDGHMTLDLPYVTGQVSDTGNIEDIHKVKVTGAVGTSEVKSHVLNIDIPDQSLSVVKKGEMPISQVRQITFDHAEVSIDTPDGSNKTKITVTPTGMKGQVKAGAPIKDIKVLTVTGHVDGTMIDDTTGTMTINVPRITGNVDGVADQEIKGIKISGNRGASAIDKGIMEIVLPAGGGTGGSITGQVDGSAQAPITKVFVKGNKGTSNVTGDVLTIDLPSGGGGAGGAMSATIDKPAGAVTQDFDSIEISGEVTNTEFDGSKLKLNIPYGSGLTIEDKDGGKSYTAITNLEFENTKFTEDIPNHKLSLMTKPLLVVWKDGTVDAAPVKEIDFTGFTKDNYIDQGKAHIHIPDIQAEIGVGGATQSLTEVKLTGSTAQSTLVDGVLTINIPSGGGGGGTGGPITGKVGSQVGEVETVEVIGNLDGSRVDSATKTLKINVPNKVTVMNGATPIDNVDIVEVANSTVEQQMVGGKVKAFIQPQLFLYFNGWFDTKDSMDKAIDVSLRVPGKTCGYVKNKVTGVDVLWVWEIGATGPEWKAHIAYAGVAFENGGMDQYAVSSIKKNDMVTVDNNGQLVVRDVTTPLVDFDIKAENGGTIVKNGKFSKVEYFDGEGTVNFDSGTNTLSVFRAQRRLDMGDDPDTTVTAFTGAEFEGSIFMNKKDFCWWGYSGKDVGTAGYKKWTRIAHPRMSDHVSSLNERVPEYLPQITTIDGTKDNPLWNKSGWTGVSANAPSGILPQWAQGAQGMVIQTFVGPSGSGVAPKEGRLQIGYMGADATMYKRYRDETEPKWSDWKKMSFNEGDLKQHNDDLEAHKKTHPFYEVFGIGVNYPALANATKGTFQYVLENELEIGLIASSGSPFAKDSTGVKVPYSGKYSVRGLAYIGGKSDLTNTSIPGDWSIELQQCPSNSSIFTTIYSQKYRHHTTTLKYPPFSFNFERVDLGGGDFLRLKIKFTPDPGKTEAQFLSQFPDLWIMPGRSFFAVDVEGQDIGYCIGKSMCRFFGGYSQLGGGAFGYQTGDWPNEKAFIVADPMEESVEAG